MEICQKCGTVKTTDNHSCPQKPLMAPRKIDTMRAIALTTWLEAANNNTCTKSVYRKAGETYLALGGMETDTVKKSDAYHRAAVMFQAAVDWDDKPEE